MVFYRPIQISLSKVNVLVIRKIGYRFGTLTATIINFLFFCAQALNFYRFGYRVSDDELNQFSHAQKFEKGQTKGQYRMLLPNGKWQTVSYVADDKGYRADVRYDGEDETDGQRAFPAENDPTKGLSHVEKVEHDLVLVFYKPRCKWFYLWLLFTQEGKSWRPSETQDGFKQLEEENPPV